MACRDYSFLSQGKWSSLSPLLKVFYVFPGGFLEELPLHSPYPSIFFTSFSPSPFPSIFSFFLSLAISLPISLIPPFTHLLHHIASHPPPTASSHLVLLPEGSSHLMCCPAFSHIPAAWISLSLHPFLDYAGFMDHLPRVN